MTKFSKISDVFLLELEKLIIRKRVGKKFSTSEIFFRLAIKIQLYRDGDNFLKKESAPSFRSSVGDKDR